MQRLRQRLSCAALAETHNLRLIQRRGIASGGPAASHAENSGRNPKEDTNRPSSTSTLRPGEIEKFSKLSESWWSSGGPFKELRSMNSLRIPLIRDGLLQAQQQAEDQDMTDTPKPLEKFTVIDVGCGGGILTEPLGRLGATVIGLDPAQDNIATANAHLSESLKSKVSYECSTLEDFAVKSDGKKFDGIVMSEVIEHLDNPLIVLAAAASLVKNGGSIFLTTPNRTIESWAGVIVGWEYILRRLPVGTHNWSKFITPAELQIMLSQNGFRMKLIHGMFYNPLTNRWSWTASTAVGYCIHAIKETEY